MSGVYIKGLKKPESCSACQFLEGDSMDGLCHAANRWLDDDEFFTWYVYAEGDVDTSKPCNCPLIPVETREDALKILAECEEMRWTDGNGN